MTARMLSTDSTEKSVSASTFGCIMQREGERASEREAQSNPCNVVSQCNSSNDSGITQCECQTTHIKQWQLVDWRPRDHNDPFTNGVLDLDTAAWGQRHFKTKVGYVALDGDVSRGERYAVELCEEGFERSEHGVVADDAEGLGDVVGLLFRRYSPLLLSLRRLQRFEVLTRQHLWRRGSRDLIASGTTSHFLPDVIPSLTITTIITTTMTTITDATSILAAFLHFLLSLRGSTTRRPHPEIPLIPLPPNLCEEVGDAGLLLVGERLVEEETARVHPCAVAMRQDKCEQGRNIAPCAHLYPVRDAELRQDVCMACG